MKIIFDRTVAETAAFRYFEIFKIQSDSHATFPPNNTLPTNCGETNNKMPQSSVISNFKIFNFRFSNSTGAILENSFLAQSPPNSTTDCAVCIEFCTESQVPVAVES